MDNSESKSNTEFTLFTPLPQTYFCCVSFPKSPCTQLHLPPENWESFLTAPSLLSCICNPSQSLLILPYRHTSNPTLQAYLYKFFTTRSFSGFCILTGPLICVSTPLPYLMSPHPLSHSPHYIQSDLFKMQI